MDTSIAVGKVNDLIIFAKKKVELLEELKESILFEQSTYAVFIADANCYVIVERETQKQIFHGSKYKVHSFFAKKNIPEEKVHWQPLKRQKEILLSKKN